MRLDKYSACGFKSCTNSLTTPYVSHMRGKYMNGLTKSCMLGYRLT